MAASQGPTVAELALEEFRRRSAELSAARGKTRKSELPEKIQKGLQRIVRASIEKQRQAVTDHIRDARHLALLSDPRIELENLLYLNVDIDQHSKVHDVPSLVTVLAEELCFKHRGWTFSGITYQSARKSARPSPTERRFTVSTVHHMVKDAILINGGDLYLRPDTVLRVVSRD